MFVAIENTSMNINDVEKWIKTARDANGGIISPEFAMEILSKTNHLGHIKKVLRNINDNCSDKEKKKYKNFVLACVDGREMSSQALEMLQELADICGVREEFDKLDNNLKIYDKYTCDLIVVKSKKEIDALKGNNLSVYCEVSGEKVLCTVNDDHYTTFCGNDLNIDLRDCDLSKVRSLRFPYEAIVNLHGAKNLPEILDFSQCSEVHLGECDLSRVKVLKFRKGAEVSFQEAKILPEVLDLSECFKVDLSRCDLSVVKELKLKKYSHIKLTRAKNLPEILDLSECIKVDLSSCDLDGVKEIKFREGANVDFKWGKNLPKVLDLSMCDKVDLKYCDLSGVKEIKFRDRKQKKEFMASAVNFEGKVRYTENTFSKMVDNVFNK
jgi:hypothetical protein